jgi:phage terminase large subunit-like protein
MARKPMHSAERYARDVVSGRILAGKLVRQACQRHLDDRQRWRGKAEAYWFDPDVATLAVEFFPDILRHSKGEWAGRRFDLEPWQQFIVWNVFGWKRPDGMRRFRTGYVEIARKNGKSTFAAGLGLRMLVADGEAGAEIYTAATKFDQAKIIHAEACRMRDASGSLTERVQCFRNNLSIAGTASKYEPLGADSDTLDGLNVHCALIDELHAHKGRGLWDVLDTATGARRQPLMFAITTAGFDQTSVCWEQHEYAEKVLSGVTPDETFFAYIAALDEGDAWDDEATWLKANPNLNVSVKFDDLRRKCEKAKVTPAAQNAFRRLHLNQWTRAETRFIDLARWDESAGNLLPEEIERACEGRRAYGGLDLATIVDLAAFVLLFPPEDSDEGSYDIVSRFWIPEDGIAERARDHGIPYDDWVRDEWITATPGNVIDYKSIREEVLLLADRYRVAEIAFDRWGAVAISTDLQEEGLTMVQFGQGYASMSAPTKELEKLVLSKRLRHGGQPVLRWNADNLEVTTDPAGNIKPVKPQHKMSYRKIDGMVALVMALSRAIVDEARPVRSVYEKRGMIFL